MIRTGSGTEVKAPHYRAGGQWVQGTALHARINSQWRRIWPPPDTHDVTATHPDWRSCVLGWNRHPQADEVQIARNGQHVKTLPGSAVTWTDDTSGFSPGTALTYTVTSLLQGQLLATGSKQTTTPVPALALSITAQPARDARTLSWNSVPGAASYRVARHPVPDTGGSWRYSGAALSFTDTGIPTGQHRYYAQALNSGGGLIATSAWVDTTVAAPPPPTTRQKTITLTARWGGSYTGAGALRGVPELYYGYYASTNGLQKSAVGFLLPDDIRAANGCDRVDKIEVSIWNLHAYDNAGANIGLAVHHAWDRPPSWQGSTAAMNTIRMPKPGWAGGSEWLDISQWQTPGRTWVGEEFRVLGACGFALLPTSSAASGYGYARGDFRVRITYTVKV